MCTEYETTQLIMTHSMGDTTCHSLYFLSQTSLYTHSGSHTHSVHVGTYDVIQSGGLLARVDQWS